MRAREIKHFIRPSMIGINESNSPFLKDRASFISAPLYYTFKKINIIAKKNILKALIAIRLRKVVYYFDIIFEEIARRYVFIVIETFHYECLWLLKKQICLINKTKFIVFNLDIK